MIIKCSFDLPVHTSCTRGFEKIELSIQSIMGKFELGPANVSPRNLGRTSQRPLCADCVEKLENRGAPKI
jgi:hypothetical protein